VRKNRSCDRRITETGAFLNITRWSHREQLNAAGILRGFEGSKAGRVLITNEAALHAHLNSGVPTGPGVGVSDLVLNEGYQNGDRAVIQQQSWE